MQGQKGRAYRHSPLITALALSIIMPSLHRPSTFPFCLPYFFRVRKNVRVKAIVRVKVGVLGTVLSMVRISMMVVFRVVFRVSLRIKVRSYYTPNAASYYFGFILYHSPEIFRFK